MTACAKALGYGGFGRSDVCTGGRGRLRDLRATPSPETEVRDGDGKVWGDLSQRGDCGQSPSGPVGSTRARSPIYSLVPLLLQSGVGGDFLAGDVGLCLALSFWTNIWSRVGTFPPGDKARAGLPGSCLQGQL